MDKPFAPYKGDGPYIFVSYSHADNRKVFSELGWLHENGFDFWYDEGIAVGTDWRDEIGEAVVGSSLCLFFVSKHSVQSVHCVREVKFALDNDIPVLPIYLEPAELPSGLGMALSNVQAVLKFSLSNARYEAQTIDALRTALGREKADIVTHRSGYRWPIVVVSLSVLLAGFVYFVTLNQTTEPGALGNDVSIAVVPFTQPGGGSLESVANALTVSVANALVSAGNVPVVSLDSSRRLIDQEEADIANRLGVSHLIKGNVQSDGTELRVFVTLVPGESDIALWSGEFRGSEAGLFDLQDRVSGSVVGASTDRLGLAEASRQLNPVLTSPLAYSLYLEEMNLDKRFPAGNRNAIQMLQQAVELDPGFVNARVELAFAYWRTTATPRTKKEKVKSALNEALARQPEHGAARALLGTIVARCEYDWRHGFELLKSAHEDYPYDARVQALWAHHLGSIHHPDAPQASLIAYQLDPLSGPAVEDYARSLFVLGRQLDALKIRQNYLDMTAHEQTADPRTIAMLIEVGRIEAAEDQLRSLETEIGPSHPELRVLRMQLALKQRDFKTAMDIEAELMERRANEEIRFDVGSPGTLAKRYRQAIEQRSTQIIFRLLTNRPRSIPASEWDEFRAMVKADEITTPVVTNYRGRSPDEIDRLVASELPVESARLVDVAGTYHADQFPPLTFEAKDDHLVVVLMQSGSRDDVRLVHSEPGVFELIPFKGYRYEFGDGTLVAWDGQIRREYLRQ